MSETTFIRLLANTQVAEAAAGLTTATRTFATALTAAGVADDQTAAFAHGVVLAGLKAAFDEAKAPAA